MPPASSSIIGMASCTDSTADRQWPDRGNQQLGAGRQGKGTRLSIKPQTQGHRLPARRQTRPRAAGFTTFQPIPNNEEPFCLTWSPGTDTPHLGHAPPPERFSSERESEIWPSRQNRVFVRLIPIFPPAPVPSVRA